MAAQKPAAGQPESKTCNYTLAFNFANCRSISKILSPSDLAENSQ